MPPPVTQDYIDMTDIAGNSFKLLMLAKKVLHARGKSKFVVERFCEKAGQQDIIRLPTHRTPEEVYDRLLNACFRAGLISSAGHIVEV